MSGLSMKFGNSGESTFDTDFSHLENNPNYNPDGEQPSDDEPSGTESVGGEPTGEQQPNGDEPVNESAGQEPTGNETDGDELSRAEPQNTPDGDEPTGNSSLNNNEPETTGDRQLTVTDEMLLQHLSEKLGREVINLDDLIPQPVEIDPQVKALNDWKEKTGRPIEDFFKYQKDFSQSSDLEIAREFLQIEYPTLNKDEINLELEKYVANDDDLEIDIDKKNLELKKYAVKGRDVLNDLKSELGEPSSATLTPEIKKQLDFAKDIQEQIEANQGQQKEYAEGITKASLSTDSMKLSLSDDLSIDFKVSEEDKKSIPSFINEMPHWRNEDGSWNHKAVVEDSVKIKHFDAMIKLAYEQGLNSGKDDLLKNAKNSTLGNTSTMDSQQGQGKKKPVIEDIDRLLGNQGISFKFGNK